MAQKNKAVKATKPKAASLVFVIITCVLLTILVIGAVFLFTPAGKLLFTGEKATGFVTWMQDNIFATYKIGNSFHKHTEFYTACLMAYLIAVALVMVFIVAEFQFFLIGHNRRVNKRHQPYRIVLACVAAALTIGSAALAILVCFNDSFLNGGMQWGVDLLNKCALSLKSGKLSIIMIPFGTTNAHMVALMYAAVFVLVLVLILDLFALIGKRKPVAVEEENPATNENPAVNEAEPEEILTEDNKNVVPVAAMAAAPAAVAATPAVVPSVPKERINPTYNELSILNALEPINSTPVADLPGLYEADTDKTLDALESISDKKDTTADDARKAAALGNDNIPVQVLPAVDEWGADPWSEDEDTEKPVKQAEPAVTEPAVTENTEVKAEDITSLAAPEKEEQMVEESKPVLSVEKPVENVSKEPSIIANNKCLHDGKRPQERDNKAESAKRNTPIQPETVLHNEYEEVKTNKPNDKDTWILPEYVEEKKPEEKKPEPAVTPIATAPVPAPNGAKAHPHIVPVVPIAHEEVKEEVKEEKVLTAVEGPLHTIKAPVDKSKIKPIVPQHVKFDLKQYQIKTYEGDLTPEQAFQMGVLKVTPTVNPVFSNQNREPSWKQRKREEEIRKNGYQDVTEIKDLKPVKPVTVLDNSVKATSIRDMVKANNKAKEEAENEKPAEVVETKKPIAPIKPIVPVKPVEADEEKPAEPKEEVNPFTGKVAVPFKPIAPIRKADAFKPRKDIKPVDPIKK